MATDAATAPKVWEGRFYEDLDVGDVFRSRFGRTVTDYDNILFTGLTHNTNSIHFDAEHAGRTQFGQILVNSTFTLALITGLSVMDATSRCRTRCSSATRSGPRARSSTSGSRSRSRTSASSRCAAAGSTSAGRS